MNLPLSLKSSSVLHLVDDKDDIARLAYLLDGGIAGGQVAELQVDTFDVFIFLGLADGGENVV